MGTQTTIARQATSHNERRQRTRSRLCSSNRGLHRNTRRRKKNLCTSSIWKQTIFCQTDVTICLRKRIPSNALRIQRIRPHTVGSKQTSNRNDRQQSTHTLFPSKANTSKTMEFL